MNAQTIPRPEVADELVDRAEIKDGTVLVEYSRTEAALQALRERFAGATFDLTTTAGDKAARSARLELVTLRNKLDKTRKEFKAPALEFGRRIDSEAKRIEGEILALEEPIDDQIKADERRREAEKAAKAEAERVRVATIRAKIDAMHGLVREAVGKTAEEITTAQLDLSAIEIGDGFAEFTAEAETVKAECIEKLGAMIEAAQATEAEAARAKAAREAEAARLAAERIEQQRVAAEQAEQARQLAEQRALIENQARELREAQERLVQQQREADEAEQRRKVLAEEAAAQALAAAEALNTPAQDSQQVLKAEPVTADATAREIPASTSPRVGAMGAAQAADAAPAEAEPATLKLGEICTRLGFTVTAAFLADTLHIQHSATDKAAKLYRESDWPRICRQLTAHISAAAELYAPDAIDA